MERMLEQYENECTFHSVECLQCGEAVQHSALPTHYMSGCIPDASIIKYPSLESTEVTLRDVSAALEDLKAMFGDPNHDPLHPVIQSQLNELTEQVRNQEARFVEITRELESCEQNLKGDMARIAATISSTVSHHLTSQQNPVEEASPSSSLPLRSEKQLIHRKLEHVADQSHDVPEHLQQTSTRLDSSRVIAHCQPLNFGIRHLTSALSATRARINAIGRLRYVPTLENCQEIIHWNGRTAMPDPGRARVHRFRDHVVAGVNW
ncbi:hypothetical protein HPB49_022990 [Dermacentor silvarum]|uniref:Uncharacterized protein n=1 Tax=Dermacentor silvarum TaxID=543639 RepID=A0ACB8DRQ0_DERSI|nr:hypothetical protein HPB49_022990 [Dermacentor silvarum]